MGLATTDRGIAEQLVEELDQLLSDRSYWQPSARPQAESHFSQRIVEIFYHDLAPEPMDFFAIRDSVIPLPSSAETDYRRLLLLGTTGVGKTTLIRQLLGTHPTRERFPSTSTAKTTIADTELILDQGLYRSVVTFLPRDLVRDYVEECLSEAVLGASRRETDSEILRHLLNHGSQRFRLSYVLGNGQCVTDEDDDEDEQEPDQSVVEIAELVDLQKTNALLTSVVASLRAISDRFGKSLKEELSASETDARVIQELFEETVYDLLREEDEFQEITEQLMDEIEVRFEPLFAVGRVGKNRQGWPQHWQWETDNREAFLKTVLRFSSNHPAYFGTLLTPLVSGIRVAGPFGPRWLGRQPHLVLLDSEGLGHSPDSSSSLPTSLSRRFEQVDAILLVDTVKHPLQAAPLAALKNIVSSGNSGKLLICFTHLDAMDLDTLPTFRAQKNHVLASGQNALGAIGEQLGPSAERALRQRFEVGCFFVGHINQELDSTSKSERRTINQLCEMLEAVDSIVQKPEPVESKPVYDRTNLVVGIARAVEQFHDEWRARLGKVLKPNVRKAHWTQIRALTRRLAEGWEDHYNDLRPIADLHKELQNRLYVFIQSPVEWQGKTPTEDEQQLIVNEFANSVTSPLLEVVAKRMWPERVTDWQKAYSQHGTGSSYVRASIIENEIYEKAAPIPDVAPLPDRQRNELLQEVVKVIEHVAARLKIKVK